MSGSEGHGLIDEERTSMKSSSCKLRKNVADEGVRRSFDLIVTCDPPCVNSVDDSLVSSISDKGVAIHLRDSKYYQLGCDIHSKLSTVCKNFNHERCVGCRQ